MGGLAARSDRQLDKINRLYVNSWGRAKEDLKKTGVSGAPLAPVFLGERGTMKNPVSEVIEVANAK